MPLKPCKECGKEVSTSADSCPHCGRRRPTGGPSWPVKVGIGIASLIVLGYVAGELALKSGVPTTARQEDFTAARPIDTSLKFSAVREQMRRELTEAQFNLLARSLRGRRVLWNGWVEDVNERALGGFDLWVDMDSPSSSLSVQDVTFEVPERLALSLRRNAPVSFEGTIESVQNVMGTLQLRLGSARVVGTAAAVSSLDTRALVSDLPATARFSIADSASGYVAASFQLVRLNTRLFELRYEENASAGLSFSDTASVTRGQLTLTGCPIVLTVLDSQMRVETANRYDDESHRFRCTVIEGTYGPHGPDSR